MFPDSETRRLPKITPALEAAVPLGAILTPLGGNVTDRWAARVVAKEENDVADGNVDGVPEMPAVRFEDVAIDWDNGVPEALPVETVVTLGTVLKLELMDDSNGPDDTDGDALVDRFDPEF